MFRLRAPPFRARALGGFNLNFKALDNGGVRAKFEVPPILPLQPPSRPQGREATPRVPSGDLNGAALLSPLPVVKNEYTNSLEMLQRIQEVTGGAHIDVPQICVAGDQSSGKSSLLRSLTGVPFPEQSGMCTKVAARVQCRQHKKRDSELFELQDPSSNEWTVVPFQELGGRILEAQEVLLKRGATTAKICADREINVRVSGPNHMDIIVNDLPGLIHTGPGKDETLELIKKYVRRERTLILLVSEAQRDDETVAAIELARQFDPTGARTIRILTKFDSFDSRESQATAGQLIEAQRDRDLGAHAVACRVNGAADCTSKVEMKHFEGSALPAHRIGVESLKDRLPKLFANLIKSNLPGLLASVCEKRRDADAHLRKIGETAASGHLMIQNFQTELLDGCNVVEEKLSTPMQDMRNEVYESDAIITEGFIEKNFTENAFRIPFFQGLIPYTRCWDVVIAKWGGIMKLHIAAVEDILEKSLNEGGHKGDSGVAQGVRKLVGDRWVRFCRVDLFPRFEEACQEALQKEAPFGTMNHYLTDKFVEHMVVPDDLIEDFLASVTSVTNKQGQIVIANPQNFMAELRTKLCNSRDRWVREFGKKGLHEQQRRRVFAVVKANLAVEQKTFTDVIHKEVVSLLQKRKHWIQNNIQASGDLLKHAVEDEAVVRRREELKSIKRQMQECEEEIRKNM